MFDNFTNISSVKSQYKYFLNRVFIFGVSSYLVLSGVIFLLNWVSSWKWFSSIDWFYSLDFNQVKFFDIFSENSPNASISEISFATIIAVILSVISIFIKNTEQVKKRLENAGKSHLIKTDDIWDNTMQSKDVEWVVARDFKNKLAYKGLIRYYSTEDQNKELLLKKVTILDVETNQELSEVPYIYLKYDEGATVVLEFLDEIE